MKKKLTYIAISIFVCLLVGFLSSFATQSSVDTWYTTLNKPSFNPPNWIPDTRNFIINNTEINIPPFPEINRDKACLNVELSIDPGLCYQEGSYQLVSNNSAFPFLPILPDSVWIDTTNNIDPEEPKHIINAQFCFDDSFWGDSTILGGILIGKFDTLLENSDFEFTLTGCDCGIREIPQSSDIEHNIFLQPDECSSGCDYPLSMVSSFVQIQCPGCEVPGPVVRNVSANRVNIDLKDANENLLPDDLTTISPSPNTKRATEGDTILIEVESFVWNSPNQSVDTATGIGMIQLSYDVNQCTFTLFPSNYANQLAIQRIDVEVIDVDNSSTTNGWVTLSDITSVVSNAGSLPFSIQDTTILSLFSNNGFDFIKVYKNIQSKVTTN